MTMVRWKAVAPATATGTSKLTLLQVVSPSNIASAIEEWSISFQGTSNTATPILVQVYKETSAGTASAGTMIKDPSDAGETLQTTSQITFTVEPSYGDLLFQEYVHPQTGYTWQAPFGRSIKMGTGQRVAIVVTAGASVNAVARINGEE